MLPLEFESCSLQPPEPIVPFSESPPILPVAVTGMSELIRPKEVCEVRLKPASGMPTRIDENEVLRSMSRQPFGGRDETEIAPF